MTKHIKPSHPGELLKRDFLMPLEISQYRIAKDVGVSQNCISEIVHGKRSISIETSLLLGKYFGMSDEFWLNMQKSYDLVIAKRKMKKRLANITPLKKVG